MAFLLPQNARNNRINPSVETAIRTVNCDVAESFKVRKTKFDGEMSATEDEEVKSWVVSFNLLEVMSKSEREQLQIDSEASNNAAPQSSDGHNSLQQQFENVEGP